MLKRSLCALLFVLAMCSHLHAEEIVIRPAMSIEEISRQMKAARYKETGLQIVSKSPDTQLKFWSVDPGVLIVTYSTVNKQVTSLTFLLTQGDDKSERYRNPFSLEVTEFTPVTGEMKIKVGKKQAPEKSQK